MVVVKVGKMCIEGECYGTLNTNNFYFIFFYFS